MLNPQACFDVFALWISSCTTFSLVRFIWLRALVSFFRFSTKVFFSTSPKALSSDSINLYQLHSKSWMLLSKLQIYCANNYNLFHLKYVEIEYQYFLLLFFLKTWFWYQLKGRKYNIWGWKMNIRNWKRNINKEEILLFLSYFVMKQLRLI